MEKNGNERIKRHKALIRQYFRAYDTDDINAVLKFIHQNHVHHPGAGAPMSFVQRKRDDEVFFKAFSKIHTSVEDLIAEGSKVVS